MSRGLLQGVLYVLCLLGVPPRYEDDAAGLDTARAVVEPAYAGRGLRAWTAMLDDPRPVRRIAAAQALGAIGPAAAPSVPELTQALDDRESWVRSQAAMALGEIGPAAADSAPAMLAALRRAGYFEGGLIGPSLAKLGPGVVPLLIEATHERGGNVRREATQALRLIGPEARQGVGRLGELARDPEGSLRIEAAYALWSVARRPEAISVLVEALAVPKDYVPGKLSDQLSNAEFERILGANQHVEYVQSEAARYLGEIGPEAKAATPALIRALHDEKPGVRQWAVNALGKIGPEAERAVPSILHLPNPARAGGDLSLAIPMAAIGPGAVPSLIDGLDDAGDGPRWTAAAALGKIGPEADAAVPMLTRLLTSALSGDRLVAAVALWRIARDVRVVPILVEIVRDADGDPVERYAALEALDEIGPAATEAVPALVHQFAVVSETNAHKVVQVLGRIGPGAAEAVATLESISTESKDGSLRTEADLTLWRITRGVKGLGALAKELQSESHLTRGSALTALSRIGPEAASAVPAIAELLRSDPVNFSTAVAALREVGPPASAILPILIEIFKEDALFDKTQVAGTIRAIDPEAAASLGIR